MGSGWGPAVFCALEVHVLSGVGVVSEGVLEVTMELAPNYVSPKREALRVVGAVECACVDGHPHYFVQVVTRVRDSLLSGISVQSMTKVCCAAWGGWVETHQLCSLVDFGLGWRTLKDRFEMKNLGTTTFLLGIELMRHKGGDLLLV